MTAPLPRKLVAILSADAENFSARMGADEGSTLADLTAARSVFDRIIDRQRGRIANTAGDGLIAEFPSVVNAVQAAVEVQQTLAEAGNALPFRIGVHLGDVVENGSDLLGDGVNMAARLQSMGAPGGVVLSRQVMDQLGGKQSYGYSDLGQISLKNMGSPVPIFAVQAPRLTAMEPFTPATAPVQEPATQPLSARIKMMMALVWVGLALCSFIFDLPGAAAWMATGLGILALIRVLPALDLSPAQRKRAQRFGPMVAAFATLALVGTAAFWILWPAAMLAALTGLKRFTPA